MKKTLLFLVRMIVASLLLVTIMPQFDLACRFLLALLLTNSAPTDQVMRSLPYVSSVKLLPYFILVLAAPSLSWKRRAVSFAGGTFVYILLDLAMTTVWRVPVFLLEEPSLAHIMSSHLWELLGHWLLPFVMAAVAILPPLGWHRQAPEPDAPRQLPWGRPYLHRQIRSGD